VYRELVLRSSRPHLGNVTAIAYSEDPLLLPHGYQGLLFTGSSDRSLRVWNAWADIGSDEACIQHVSEHAFTVTGIVGTGVGSVVSCSLDSTVRLWRPDGGKSRALGCAQTLTVAGRRGLTAIALNRGGPGMPPWRLFVGDEAGRITTIAITGTGDLVPGETWSGLHTLGVAQLLVVEAERYLVSASNDCSMLILDYSTKSGGVVFRLPPAGFDPFGGLAWDAAADQLLASTRGGRLVVWSQRDKAVSSTHALLEPLDPNSASVARHGTAVRRAAKEFATASLLAWLQPGVLACLQPQRASVMAFQVVRKSPPLELRGHCDLVIGLASVRPSQAATATSNDAVSGAERLVLSASADGTIRCWDERTGSERYQCACPSVEGSEPATLFTLEPLGLLVVGCTGGGVSFFHPDRGLVARAPRGHANTVSSICFCEATALHRPEPERFLVSASFDGSIGLWLLHDETGKLSPRLDSTIPNAHGVFEDGSPREVLSAAFHPPSELIVSGGNDGVVRCWCGGNRSPRLRLHGHGDSGVTALAADSRSGRLVSAGEDATLRLWDLGTARLRPGTPEARGPLTTVAGGGGPVRTLTLDPLAAGVVVATGAWGLVSVWGFSPDGAEGSDLDEGADERIQGALEPLLRKLRDIEACEQDDPPACAAFLGSTLLSPPSLLIGTSRGLIIKVER